MSRSEPSPACWLSAGTLKETRIRTELFQGSAAVFGTSWEVFGTSWHVHHGYAPRHVSPGRSADGAYRGHRSVAAAFAPDELGSRVDHCGKQSWDRHSEGHRRI